MSPHAQAEAARRAVLAARQALLGDLRALAAEHRLGVLANHIDALGRAAGGADILPWPAASVAIEVQSLIEVLDDGDPAWRSAVWSEVDR